ncbi:GlxA family transcriptional regulator [Pseudonocardia adelaidensis]|uniref:GlxA family transcriptional regulator n=1 Tax=Pseudonocardia adelaidensis TaxID=648754 RepID=UPI003CD09733
MTRVEHKGPLRERQGVNKSPRPFHHLSSFHLPSSVDQWPNFPPKAEWRSREEGLGFERMIKGSLQRPHTPKMHVVAVLVTPAASVLELAIPAEVFGRFADRSAQGQEKSRPRYVVRMCAMQPGLIPVSHGVSIRVPHGLDELSSADTVFIVSGNHDYPPEPPPALVKALEQAHSRGARVVAVRSGVCILAATGLLDGRRVASNADLADNLRQHHPAVHVMPSILYTADENIVTCAGGTAVLDLCLDIVRRDHGVTVTHGAARQLLAPPHRSGDQAQAVDLPLPERTGGMSELLDWIRARLDQPLALSDLAEAANVSPRTLARRFHSALGMTPIQWITNQRIRLAQHLLETTEDPISEIARTAGLGGPGNLRQQLVRTTGLSPRDYRRRFGRSGHGIDLASEVERRRSPARPPYGVAEPGS